MRKSLMFRLLSVMLVLFVVTSCGEDDIDGENGSNSVTISIDGVEQTVTNVFTEFNHKGTSETNGIESKQALLGISVSTTTTITNIVLGFSMLDNAQSSTCMEDGNYKEYNDGGPELEFYILGRIGSDFIDLRDDVTTNEILATITSCDASNDKVSGSFNFEIEAEDFDTGDLTYYTVDGTFTNVSFIRTD